MRRVGVNTNVPAPKRFADRNHYNRVDLKEGRNGPPWMSEECESRINEDVNIIGPSELVQAHAAFLRQQQQPQGPVVKWENFLPVSSLKVLLVESDAATRRIVSALLRNCSYEVMAVANGLDAWKLLIDLNKQIDMVLTAIDLPYISGIGLLSKIMNHVTRKNIPVIMMSSDGSRPIVHDCISRGAVDFLLKPIRKNELKILWQHVWRKCQSSSGSGGGSGSESGIQDHKSTKSRSIQESDDGGDKRDEDDDVSIELNDKGGSDNGSGTQSPWPKKVVEVYSSQADSLWDKVPNPNNITSSQVARPDTSKLEVIEMGKDLEIGVPKSSSYEVEDTNKKMDKFCESNMKKAGDKVDISMQLGCETSASRTKPLNADKEALKANHLLKKINIEDNYSKESHALELSLKRPRDLEDADVSAHERNVLRHSGLSAFSRYTTASNFTQTPTGNVDSCSPPPNISSEAAKPNNILSNSNETPNQRSNGSDDLGSTTNNAFTTKPDDKPPPTTSTIDVHNHHTSTLQPLIPYKDDAVKTTITQPKAPPVPQEVQVNHHYIYHHYYDLGGSVKNMMSVLTASTEGNAANYGGASGSNNKSNGENGNGNVEDGKIEKGNGGSKIFNGGYGNGNGSGSGSGSGVVQERSARREVKKYSAEREAALIKFRQKRKERCFVKKVRYQSRKKLAEQRPRVRGQFVRHGAKGVNNEEADS